jgi:hypothetical protein
LKETRPNDQDYLKGSFIAAPNTRFRKSIDSRGSNKSKDSMHRKVAIDSQVQFFHKQWLEEMNDPNLDHFAALMGNVSKEDKMRPVQQDELQRSSLLTG